MVSNQMPANPKVAVFVDYRNLWHSLQTGFGTPPSPASILAAIMGEAQRHGTVLVAKAYADWTSDPTGAKAAQAQGFDPELVLRKYSGGDRSDATMMLDAYDVRERPDVSVCVLVTGDADFRAVIRRLKGAGKQVVVCAVAQSASRDLMSEANPFVSVESLLQISPVSPEEQETRTLEPFLRTVNALEERLPFMGLTYLRDTIIRPGTVGNSSARARQVFLSDLITKGILETYPVPNPKSPEFPTTAVRLNRKHRLVQAVFGSPEQDGSDG